MKNQTVSLTNKINLSITFVRYSTHINLSWAIIYPLNYYGRSPVSTTGEILPDVEIWGAYGEKVMGQISDFLCVLCDVKPYRNDGTMKFEGDCKAIYDLVYEIDGLI